MIGKILIKLIELYRKNISPRKIPWGGGGGTCSAYAIEAIQKRGAFVGTLLSIWRILRCNPLCKGGYDPVTEKKGKKSD